MPRGRCHFALLLALQTRLEADLPETGKMTARYFPDFLAGSLAPDAMRSLGRMGKLRTHFYEEGRRETWGQSVSGLFGAHADLADPDALCASDCVMIMGYISHLTADEAFRDMVTVHVHGIDSWRPIIRGLWSLIDELDISHPDLGGVIDQFQRQGSVGFIDCDILRTFLTRARDWAISDDPWLHERVFLKMIGSDFVEAEARAQLEANRTQASVFLDGKRREAFVAESVGRAYADISRFVSGGFTAGGKT